METSGQFKGIKQAKVIAGGVYVAPGVYTLRLKRCTVDKTRKQRPFFVAEFETLESTNPDRPTGGTQSWMVMLDNDAALGNIKAFFSALAGVNPEEITEDFCEQACSDKNPVAGLKILADASNIKTRSGGDFTKVSWTHIPLV